MPILKLYANLRGLAGANQLLVSGSSVRAALNDAIRLAPGLQPAILGDGDMGADLVLILNGLTVTDLDAPVHEDDTLSAFPPIAGGEVTR